MGPTGRRRRIVGAMGLVAALTAACVPDPAPAPRWVTTRAPRVATETSVTNLLGAWTSEDWAASTEYTSVTGGGGTTAVIDFFPRSGPGNATLGAPVQLPLTVGPSFAGVLGGERVVGVGSAALVELFVLDGGAWVSGGVVTVPPEREMVALNDDWMVLRWVPMSPGAPVGLDVWAVQVDGQTATATPYATLQPDDDWPASLATGFGSPSVALDGDLLAVGAQGMLEPVRGGVMVFRHDGTAWQEVYSGRATADDQAPFARSLAVDDGATVDRFAISPQTTSPVVEVWADSGAGFALEQSVACDPAGPDTFGGAFCGNAIALDGDLLAVSARGVNVPSATPGHDAVGGAHVQLFRRGSTWAREAEVPVYTDPAPGGIRSMYPLRLQAAGNHVAVSVFVSPDPPPGCVFPCLNFGFEAWSIDRRP